jgi:hypothetical protein
MSQCYIPSLYIVHFKGAPDSGEAQVINQKMAEAYWPGDNPISKQMRIRYPAGIRGKL